MGDGPVGGLPVQRLSVHQPQPLGRQQVMALASPATALQFTFWANHSWLLLSGLNPTQQEQLLTAPTTLASEVLWWDGSPLSPNLLAAVQPRVAIAATRSALYRTGAKSETQRNSGILSGTRRSHQLASPAGLSSLPWPTSSPPVSPWTRAAMAGPLQRSRGEPESLPRLR
jgi:hypothetical protein